MYGTGALCDGRVKYNICVPRHDYTVKGRPSFRDSIRFLLLCQLFEPAVPSAINVRVSGILKGSFETRLFVQYGRRYVYFLGTERDSR